MLASGNASLAILITMTRAAKLFDRSLLRLRDLCNPLTTLLVTYLLRGIYANN
jgi:hypothetical protein